MDKSKSETEMEELEQEVLDQLENPYRPYSVIFPYEVRFTIPDGNQSLSIIVVQLATVPGFGSPLAAAGPTVVLPNHDLSLPTGIVLAIAIENPNCYHYS